MQTFNATDVKRDFGEMLLRVQKEPVAINKNGKPVAVILSNKDYEYLEALHRFWSRFGSWIDWIIGLCYGHLDQEAKAKLIGWLPHTKSATTA